MEGSSVCTELQLPPQPRRLAGSLPQEGPGEVGNAQNLHRFTAVNSLSSWGGGIPQQRACGTGGTEDKMAQPWSGWLRAASYNAAYIELRQD